MHWCGQQQLAEFSSRHSGSIVRSGFPQCCISPVSYTHQQDASVAGFNPYEQPTVRDLLYGVLLPSGADACETLARAVGGSEEGFVAMMNQKAEELGLTNTHFENCTGLHNDNHYSTCRDIAVLMSECLKSCLLYTSRLSTFSSCSRERRLPLLFQCANMRRAIICLWQRKRDVYKRQLILRSRKLEVNRLFCLAAEYMDRFSGRGKLLA